MLRHVALIEGAEPAGWEWYLIPGPALDEVFRVFESVVGEPVRVPLKDVRKPNRWH